MGFLVYNAGTEYEFADRSLAHIQIVVGAKLRRNESFSFTWDIPTDYGSGRIALWLHPAIPLVYRFDGSRTPIINRLWIEALMTTANSASGMALVPEPTR